MTNNSMTNNDAFVSLADVSKHFGSVVAVDHLSFTINSLSLIHI